MNLFLTIALRNYLCFFLTFNQFPNYTKNWHSDEKNGSIIASFEEFNGKQDFKLHRNAKGVFMLKYAATAEKGKLQIEVKQGSKTIVQREVNGSVSDSIKLDNTGDEKYQVIFRAVHAKGKFELKY